MEETLVAPCGMNCALCVHYLAGKYDLRKQGFHKTYCEGCLPRGKNCLHMGRRCMLLGQGLVRFCYECPRFPCQRIKAFDKRYRTQYHMSAIGNLKTIQARGMPYFLKKEEEIWHCPTCGGVICVHNGLCLRCQIDRLRQNQKYRWGD